ncbi:MAG TPA: type I glyceraldehyde-3-phosphate dehydrogenase [Bacteroidales bacterium]|nr:type I glyceraldehyde-3-phosphate dehydrogenase [Bacteroidales bacterium]HSA42967.1 type I glyceraldehyde-3-phosphate dehydrogenase [Bacteroidales bacterium]
MKKIRIAINGFGRIGRMTFRRLVSNPDIDVVAINDLTDTTTLAHLLRYDSVHGVFGAEITHTADSLLVNGRRTFVYAEAVPDRLPWGTLDIDIVLEATGVFKDKKSAFQHIKAGARKVIISAPATSEGVKFIVIGINEQSITSHDIIISNASCTTNCVAPLIQVLDQYWGIEKGFITTVHSYTADQNLIDAPHKDLRRARAAAVSIVPTTTGAAKAATHIFPHLTNNLAGCGIRVPVPDGSLTDFSCTLSEPASTEEINAAFRAASEGKFKGILQYTEDPIVSVDVIGNPHSAIFDAGLTSVLGDKNRLVKVVAWYDNETAYAARLTELISIFDRI